MGPGAEPVNEDNFQDKSANGVNVLLGRELIGHREEKAMTGLVGRGVVGSVQLGSGYKQGRQEGKYEENSNGNLWVMVEISLSL